MAVTHLVWWRKLLWNAGWRLPFLTHKMRSWLFGWAYPKRNKTRASRATP